MATDINTQASIAIEAPAPRVWEAITTPEQIARWFFGVDTETEWNVGGPIVHRGEYQGESYEDRGTVLAFEPDRLLVHTHWSSVSGLPHEPEHEQTVSWSLLDLDGGTELTISETNLPSAEAKAVSEQGWTTALASLKELLEG